MDLSRPTRLVPLAALLVGAAAIALWLALSQPPETAVRVPRQEERDAQAGEGAVERNAGTLIAGQGTPSELTGSWPQFRGADRTNVVRDAAGLTRSWGGRELRVLWTIEAGEGHSGAAVRDGRVYMMDYDREKLEDQVRCLSFDDGADIWRYTYYVKVKRNHGMSRTVPAVSGDYVVTLGPKCHVVCLDARQGTLIWKKDLVAEHGTEVPPWYAGECPLIDGGNAILAPGGEPLMMAVELATGKTVWETPNPGGWGMTHSSVVAVEVGGERQFVYCTTLGVVGVSAQDGRLLWRLPEWKINPANVAMPVPVGGDRLFLSGGYNKGCMMLRLPSGSEPETLWRLPAKTFGSDQHTPILHEEHIYGTIPPKGELACLDLEGNRLWTSGGEARFGLGPYILADGLLFVLSDEGGTLHVAEASPDGYNELGVFHVLHGHDAWAPMAMADGRLILRDLTQVVCLELPRE